MKNFMFPYKGHFYSATLVSSHAEDIQYHWVVFDTSSDLTERIGDTIAYHLENGRLVPTYQYSRLSEVVDKLRCTVELLLKHQRTY